jgi:hypothetical protein
VVVVVVVLGSVDVVVVVDVTDAGPELRSRMTVE